MLIILEGPRNSGKTTTANRLKEYLGGNSYIIKFQRTSRPAPPVFMIDFLTKNYLALIDSRSICILDRFHLTEYVMRSLDGKVDQAVLNTTTHMIDHALKNIGAITYVLEANATTRNDRLKHRDIDHRTKEWPDYKELDGAWSVAKKSFAYSNVKPWKVETPSDVDALLVDAFAYVGGGKLLNEKIPFFPPIVEVSAELVAI